MKKLIIVLLMVALVLGLIWGSCNIISLPKDVFFSYNRFSFSFNILIYLLAYGLTFLTIPGFLFILVYEIVMLGVIIVILLFNYGIKSLFYLMFILLMKSIIIFLLVLNVFYYCKYVKYLYSFLLRKNNISKHNYNLYFKKITIITIFILIIIILYGLLNKYLLLVLVNKLL